MLVIIVPELRFIYILTIIIISAKKTSKFEPTKFFFLYHIEFYYLKKKNRKQSCGDLLYTILCFILTFASIAIYLHVLAKIILCLQMTVYYMKHDIYLYNCNYGIYIQASFDFCYVQIH